MGRNKKDFKKLNIKLDKRVYLNLNYYCELLGIYKTDYIEQLIYEDLKNRNRWNDNIDDEE